MDIEKQLRELDKVLQHARVDGQWGDAGEYWRIAGAGDLYSKKRLEAVARIAGEKLRSAIGRLNDSHEDMLTEDDPIRFWYKGIWHVGKNFNYDYPGSLLDEKGNSIGHIHTGHIDRIAEASAIFCLELASLLPDEQINISNEEQKYSTLKNIWNKYGKEIVIGVIITVVGGIVLSFILG